MHPYLKLPCNLQTSHQRSHLYNVLQKLHHRISGAINHSVILKTSLSLAKSAGQNVESEKMGLIGQKQLQLEKQQMNTEQSDHESALQMKLQRCELVQKSDIWKGYQDHHHCWCPRCTNTTVITLCMDSGEGELSYLIFHNHLAVMYLLKN